MAWTAAEVVRIDEPLVADERTMMERWLDWHRSTLLHKCSGLTAEQLAERAVPPSGLSLLGLVRHMAEVERAWFCDRFAGAGLGPLYKSAERPEGDFDDAGPATAEADFAVFGREVERARAASAGHSLEATFYYPRREKQISLRWVYIHMIEEYARHNGHADLIRERIDGVIGS